MKFFIFVDTSNLSAHPLGLNQLLFKYQIALQVALLLQGHAPLQAPLKSGSPIQTDFWSYTEPDLSMQNPYVWPSLNQPPQSCPLGEELLDNPETGNSKNRSISHTWFRIHTLQEYLDPQAVSDF